MLKALWHDELGATLTTELVLLLSLTVAGVLTLADDIRSGVEQRTKRLASAISNVGHDLLPEETVHARRDSQLCVIVVESDDIIEELAD